jgi:hypothetical protein
MNLTSKPLWRDRSGGRIRISARLLHVVEERHLWAQTYDRDVKDILMLEQEIVNAIVTSASAALKQQGKQAAVKAIHPKAYESFLKGNFLVSFRAPQSLEKAFAYYQSAIDLEPLLPTCLVYKSLSQQSLLKSTADYNAAVNGRPQPDNLESSDLGLAESVR